LDKQFLEFWGNLLLAAARGQQQFEELAAWVTQGMEQGRELNAVFRRVYGLGDGEPSDDAGRRARSSFDRAYAAYLAALGAVPCAEHAALERKCAELQQRVDRQEAELRSLRSELGAARMAEGDVIRGFQELVRVQSDQFQDVTESFNRLVTGAWAADPGPKKR